MLNGPQYMQSKSFVKKVNPSTPQYPCWSCPGLTLSGVSASILRDGSSICRTGQPGNLVRNQGRKYRYPLDPEIVDPEMNSGPGLG